MHSGHVNPNVNSNVNPALLASLPEWPTHVLRGHAAAVLVTLILTLTLALLLTLTLP
jgi:hypothetical protein